MYKAPIRNTKLFEQVLQTSSNQVPGQSKISWDNAGPKPIDWKGYFSNIYGEYAGGAFEDMLASIWGPDWLELWQDIINNPDFEWPGWTLSNGGEGYMLVQPVGCTSGCTMYSVEWSEGD